MRKLNGLDKATIICLIHNTIDKIEGVRGISVRNPEKMTQPECEYYLELTKIITEQIEVKD